MLIKYCSILSFRDIALCFLFIVSSCSKPSKDLCNENYLVKLPSDIKNQIPYRKGGLDTLVFDNLFGQIDTLYGTGKVSTLLQERYVSNGECDDITDYELLYFQFRSSNAVLPSLTFHYRAYANYVTYANVYLGKEALVPSFSNGGLALFKNYSLPSDTNYIRDTIIINHRVLRGINVNLSDKYNLERTDTSVAVFYSYKYGIARIKSGNNIWNRKL